ncbi:unnamed protein product, partial [Citrullus colocynthis]
SLFVRLQCHCCPSLASFGHQFASFLPLCHLLFRVSAILSVEEVLPLSLDATAEQPPLFNGTTRLYTAYICPYAQCVWITQYYKVC